MIDNRAALKLFNRAVDKFEFAGEAIRVCNVWEAQRGIQAGLDLLAQAKAKADLPKALAIIEESRRHWAYELAHLDTTWGE